MKRFLNRVLARNRRIPVRRENTEHDPDQQSKRDQNRALSPFYHSVSCIYALFSFRSNHVITPSSRTA